jgi:uncharacterized protein (TIGR03435 family)
MAFANVSLNDLVEYGWDVKDFQISGPGWMESTRFDVLLKVSGGATKEQTRVMMQHLLEARFGLVLRHSTKEESIYRLVVAKNGSKLEESSKQSGSEPVDESGRGGGGRGAGMMMEPGGRMKLVANGATIADFLRPLALQLDRPVVDQTGLTGKYDITLEFTPDPAIMRAKMAALGVGPPPAMTADGAQQGPSGGSTDSGPAETIFSALPDQLGLRLESRRGPVDFLIIDNIRKKPTEN